jgi:hypothetical protein
MKILLLFRIVVEELKDYKLELYQEYLDASEFRKGKQH